MMGAAISRWTMSYFAAALVFLIAAEGLMVAGYGFPAAPMEAPETLVLVHMVTIGWLSLLMCGALFQFVPVLVATPLRYPALVLPAFVLLLTGLGCLLGGFLQLAGSFDADLPLLAMAGVFLPSGFALAVWVIAVTLWAGRPLALPARFVAVGLFAVVVVAMLGASFAFVLSGTSPFDPLIELRPHILTIHVAIGFGGWLGFTAIGVSYRLLPMFMLSPESERSTAYWVWWCGSAALLLIALIVPATLLLAVGTGPVITVACLLAFLALGLYAADLTFFYRHRRRRTIELNSSAALGAFAMLYLAVLLFAALLLTGTLEQHVGALIHLIAFGWLTGLGLSQLYKIVPFLTWLECYGPVMGRQPTPRVQDMVVEKRDMPWFAVYFLGVLVCTAALLADQPTLFRILALMPLMATVAIVVELIGARRLSNIAAERRLPPGTMQPRLFLPPTLNWRRS
ncbi:hypothetical protein ATN84_14400 [Paramesorhizobium deserti]|uniref:Cytochrome oxidase subunit I profile domain-containing protein n=1 Tax=Paramesorhizobium deserti TaxID=1494590 RepID=A0A135HSC0_9HYPH|nr:hypothetical protein [Paramesorhizobium deserti]KXF76097.1 hypothetical protein ATN84_14400 [Paramesorhizobium deserti]